MPTQKAEGDGLSLVTTADGTFSLYSEEFGEAMHTVSGAFNEALVKHVFPSAILEKTDTCHVLDIGCGIGYNILALLYEQIRKKVPSFINVDTIDRDWSALPFMEKISFGDERDEIYKSIIHAVRNGEAHSSTYNISFYTGDARRIITKLEPALYDAVFQDPYSPNKNPELWTVDFFREIARVIKKQGIITTYSSAVQVRRAFIEAGFRICRGPAMGNKREGTLATQEGNIDYLSDDDTRQILENPRSLPYRDNHLNDSRLNIINRRLHDIRLIRDRRVP